MFSFIHRLFGGGGEVRFVTDSVTKSHSHKKLTFDNYPVNLGALDPNYVNDTINLFMTPISKEYPTFTFEKEKKFRTESDGSVTTDITFEENYDRDSSCLFGLNFSYNEGKVVVYLSRSIDCDKDESGKPRPNRFKNLRLQTALQGAAGKILNKFIRDADILGFVTSTDKSNREEIDKRLTEFMNSKGAQRLNDFLSSPVVKNVVYKGLATPAQKKYYEKKITGYATFLGPDFFTVLSGSDVIKGRVDEILREIYGGDDVINRVKENILNLALAIRELQNISSLEEVASREKLICDGITIFANVDKIQGPIPFSITVNINGIPKVVRVRTLRNDGMQVLYSKLQQSQFPDASIDAKRIFNWGISTGIIDLYTYVILICRDNKTLASKFIDAAPKDAEYIWDVSGGLANPSGEKGLGSLLMDCVTELAKFHKVSYISISTVNEAYEFYKKVGFTGNLGDKMTKPTGYIPKNVKV